MKQIRTEIRIDAAPHAIWQALVENGDWGAWNPFVTRVEGAFAAGATLKNTLVLPGQKPMTVKPKVITAEPGRELRWLGQLFVPFLFSGEHYFQIEADGAQSRFVHGEIFRGLLVGVLDMRKAEAAFRALNEGLKRKVEAQARA